MSISFLRYLKYSNVKDRITYLKWYTFIKKSQYWSKEELIHYQWLRLKCLLDYAFANVPYYNELLKSIGAIPDDIKSIKDFKEIPLLTKDIIRNRSTDLISRTYANKRQLAFFTTGGSTGEPLGFYKARSASVIEHAFMGHQWSLVGYKESSKRAILRGDPVKGDRLFQKFRFSKDWLLSSYHLSEETITSYVNFLNEIQPDFFHVYPSTFYIFTQLLIKSNLTLSFSPKAILCGSEPVFNHQRELFEKVFNTRVYSWLGQAEGAILAGECEYSADYHAWPQHGYVELLDENGEIIDDFNKSGEIIGTTINNYSFPFIRYKTGDLATYKSDHCEKCGRHSLILTDLQGRIQDTVLLSDGTPFPICPAIFGIHDEKWSLVNCIQIVQEKKGEIILRVDTYSDKFEVETFLRKVMDERIGHVLRYQLVFTREIEKTKHGKHRLLIQKL